MSLSSDNINPAVCKTHLDQEGTPSDDSPPPYSSSIVDRFESHKHTRFFGLHSVLTVQPNLSPPFQQGKCKTQNDPVSALGCFRAEIDGNFGVDLRSSSHDSQGNLRTTLNVKTGRGCILADLRSWGTRSPFQLRATTRSGLVIVFLPRSFRGILSLSTAGKITLSKQLTPDTSILRQIGSTNQLFVGPVPDEKELDEEKWTGDHVIVSSKSGNIRLEYFDENPRRKTWELKIKGLFWIRIHHF